MSLYSSPPPVRPFSDVKPTLLVGWWITIFCTIIVLLRVLGRYVRVEKLLIEDKISALSLIPLYIRIGFVHAVFVLGTNNAQFAGLDLSDNEIHRRALGSGFVLASRLFYAATLWTIKAATLEFFKRLTGAERHRSYATVVLVMRCILGATFFAVLVSDLAECRPFSKYWQVFPDPGGQCRQGHAQLLTMAVCTGITDLLLVVAPVPIIISSRIDLKRKIFLILLFSLGLLTVCVTIYRVPAIISKHGDQETRSMWASVELLLATAVGNAVALGSFMRGSGVKKRKFDHGQAIAAGYRPNGQGSSLWRSAEDKGLRSGSKITSERERSDSDATIDTKSRTPETQKHDRTLSFKSPGDGTISATQSRDSLIPREQEELGYSVSVSASRGKPRRVIPASDRGIHRGTTIVIQEVRKV